MNILPEYWLYLENIFIYTCLCPLVDSKSSDWTWTPLHRTWGWLQISQQGCRMLSIPFDFSWIWEILVPLSDSAKLFSGKVPFQIGSLIYLEGKGATSYFIHFIYPAHGQMNNHHSVFPIGNLCFPINFYCWFSVDTLH